jgi:Zn-dependent protease with chaperone function
MTRVDFDDLVGRIEARYAGRPAALARWTLAWVAVGIGVLVSWVVVLVLAGVGLLTAGTIVPTPLNILLLLGGVVLVVFGLCQLAYLLRVESAPRTGRVLRHGDAPALDAVLAELRRALRCRPFDEVRLTLEFNAAIHPVPRLGFLGWPRTHLEIGLPLALALSREELRAVLVHEGAHLSARHGRLPGRLYLLHQSWANLMRPMHGPARNQFDRVARWALARFLEWYWPRLHARALVLSRTHEYQADRQAADLVGAAAVTGALWRVECYEPWLADQFWIDLWQRARDVPDPPPDVYRLLGDACRAGPPPADAARHAERALSRIAPRESTHPAMLDRVRALGQSAEDVRRAGFPPAPPANAAELFLGERLPDLARELSEQWRMSALTAWRDRHRLAVAEAKTAADAAAAELIAADVHSLWQAARDVANRDGLGPAIPLLQQVLEREPGHAGAAVFMGQHLSRLGDPEGERLLLAVVTRQDEDWLSAACMALEEHYRSTGMNDRVHEMRSTLDRHESDLRAAQQERAGVTARDRFLPHGLGDEPLMALQALLAATADVEAAWLARKDVRYLPQRPLFVLCVRATGAWWGGADRDTALVRRLTPKVQLPGQFLVIGRRGPFRALARKVAAQCGPEVFRPARS